MEQRAADGALRSGEALVRADHQATDAFGGRWGVAWHELVVPYGTAV